MIFSNLFHRSFERGRFISDGYYLTTLLFLCQLFFPCFLYGVLLVRRVMMATTACPPQAKKISRSVRSDDTEQCFTKPARHRDERIYTLYRPIYIGAVKRHRISTLLPESRPRKADALPAVLRQLYMYIIYFYTLIL